jgi:hypothetical protein
MKALETKQEREVYIGWQLKRATEPFGYRLGPSIHRRADRVWCFSRVGARFKTDLLLAGLRWRPKKSMSIDFFGSPHSHEYLAEHGLTQNAGGFNLHYYQVDHLDQDADDLLAPQFGLGSEKEWSIVFDRLAAEIASVEPRIWTDLWEAWNATMVRAGGQVEK